MITWNSLKTRNSLSGELWVLRYDFFTLHIFFRDTWNHSWKTEWKVCVCVSVYEDQQVLRMFLKYQGF